MIFRQKSRGECCFGGDRREGCVRAHFCGEGRCKCEGAEVWVREGSVRAHFCGECAGAEVWVREGENFGEENSEAAFIKSQIIDKFVTMELFGRLQKVAEKRQKNRYLII